MPGVPAAGDDQFGYQFARLVNHVRGLSTQQQETLTNSLGQAVLNFGLSPGSNPAQFGLQFLNPATGGQLMFVGEDGAGNAYMGFYDGNGVMRIKIDEVGFHVYNAAGQEEARLGQLNASPAIYGLGVAPATGGTPGTLQQVGGAIAIAATSVNGTTATAWTNFPGTSSLTAEIGPSGEALVTTSCYIATGDQYQGGRVGVSIDGGTTIDFLQLSESVGAGGLSDVCGATFLLSGMTAGSHTFQLQYQTFNNGANSVNFDSPTMVVQPL